MVALAEIRTSISSRLISACFMAWMQAAVAMLDEVSEGEAKIPFLDARSLQDRTRGQSKT